MSNTLSPPQPSIVPLFSGAPPEVTLRPGSKRRRIPCLSITLLAWSVRLSATINFAASLLRHEPRLIYWLGAWVPFEISEGRRILMLLTSVLLMILASGLERGKRTAWGLTMMALAMAPILHLGRAVVWPQALLNLALIGFLLFHHRQFVALSDQRSVRSALIVCPLLLVALLTFGTIRLRALEKQTTGDHTPVGCLQTASELVLVQNTDTQRALTPHARHLFSDLRVGGASIGLIALLLTLRPVLLRWKAPLDQRENVRKLIEEFGRDPFDSYALLEDKSYFFTEDGQVVIPYVLSSNLAVALADPIGPPVLRPKAIAEFTHYCRGQDWEPVFYEISENSLPLFKREGFSTFKIGEDARLRADQYRLKGSAFQNLRTACNRAHKLGIRFRWYQAIDGIDELLESQLNELSGRWLEAKKAGEMSFDMGAFSLQEIRERGAGVAVDAGGRPLAFATWRPFAQGRGKALDLMRAAPEARNVMDFVLVESILHFQRQGITDVSLGNAPLANVSHDASRAVAEDKVVQFLFENLNRVYGYKSLFEFKRKYRPEWRGRYVAYRRGVNLPMVGLALVRVHAPEGIWKFLVG
jgi:phosphatidylglycerol lysyltransferase